jgi:ABC-type dipeptide/oligopeptide/nickel transport system permease subunit
MDAFTPPSWTEDGLAKFILGTDGQGRDMLSTILYGSRISLIVGFSAIIFSLILGVGLGLTAGFFGGKYEMDSNEINLMFNLPVPKYFDGTSSRWNCKRTYFKRDA